MQMWLDECMTLTARNLVDNSILNFNTLIDSVRYNNFDICLPPTFIATACKEGKKNKGGTDNNNNSDKNEKKKARTQIDNPSQPTA